LKENLLRRGWRLLVLGLRTGLVPQFCKDFVWLWRILFANCLETCGCIMNILVNVNVA